MRQPCLAPLTEATDKKNAQEQAITAYKDFKEAIWEHNFRIPTYIIIDELDRCRPDYALKYLERIKHIFEVVNLRFVITSDNNQLASIIQ
jgi:predicted KAP-like P-loop ATPase